jgi:hypothetical protein
VIDFGVGRWGRRAKPWPHVEPLKPVGLRCGAARRSCRRTRCARRKEWAAEHAEYLGKYGISPGKLTKFKNAIAAFDTAKSAPSQNRVTKSAAAQLLPQLVRSAVAVVRDQLDGLMVQFKDAEPNFYEEYFAARVVGASKGSRAEKVQENTNPVPSTQPAAKAA